MADNDNDIDFSDSGLYSLWELVEDKTTYETRKKTFTYVSNYIAIVSTKQGRPVRQKTYECTIREDPDVAELPAPSYLAGNNELLPNPENLRPRGWMTDQWHPVDIQYTKTLSEPLSRRMRVTWEKFGPWFGYDDESDSSN